MGLALDHLVAQSARPGVPDNERKDINAQILGQVIDGLKYPDPDEVRFGIDELLRSPFGLQKAVRLDPYVDQRQPPRGHQREHTSILYVNEFGLIDPGDGKSRWIEKRGVTGFQFLRDVAYSVDIIGAIISTRQRQIEPFLVPERDQGPLGFRFVRVDGERVGDQDAEPIRHLEAMLMNGGDVEDYFERRYLRRDGLSQFVNKFLYDSLTADACPIELTRTRGRNLSGWHAVPFDTVRLCAESGYEGRDEICGVQVYDAVPRVAYTYQDLIYEIRNPRTDLTAGGYGYAETESVVRALTAYVNAVTFNAAGIDRNATPRGLITLFGKYSDDQLEKFRRQMKTMLSGASQRHGVPIIAAEEKGAGAAWTPMDTFDEMFFTKRMVFTISMVCARFGIDPTEINSDSFTIRGAQIGGKSDTQERLSLSRDKGLLPLLMFVQRILNILVSQIDPRYKLEFVGLHEEDEERKQERIKLSRTINEIREIDGAEPMDSELIGGAPANQALLGLYMAEAGVQMPGQGGDAGAGDGGESPADEGTPQDRIAKASAAGARVQRVSDFMVVIEPGEAA